MIRASLVGLATAILAALLLARPLLASEPVVSVAEVVAMQRAIPICESCEAKGAMATVGDAHAIAVAISGVARTRQDAAELALFAAWESGNNLRALGDRGQSFGAWQIRGYPAAVAFDPTRGARAWLAIADGSRARCASLPEEEQLAALVSGSCMRGREKARRRYSVGRALWRRVVK